MANLIESPLPQSRLVELKSRPTPEGKWIGIEQRENADLGIFGTNAFWGWECQHNIYAPDWGNHTKDLMCYMVTLMG